MGVCVCVCIYIYIYIYSYFLPLLFTLMYPNLLMPTNVSLFPYLLFQNVCTIIPQDVAAAFFLLTTCKACFSPFCPYNIKSPDSW